MPLKMSFYKKRFRIYSIQTYKVPNIKVKNSYL
jgi:hypothetical protein